MCVKSKISHCSQCHIEIIAGLYQLGECKPIMLFYSYEGVLFG